MEMYKEAVSVKIRAHHGLVLNPLLFAIVIDAFN